MSMAQIMKQAGIIMDYFEKKYQAKHGERSGTNRVKQKWDVKDMLESVGASQAKTAIDFYFTMQRKHTLQELCNNFDYYLRKHALKEQDRERRAALHAKRKRELNGI